MRVFELHRGVQRFQVEILAVEIPSDSPSKRAILVAHVGPIVFISSRIMPAIAKDIRQFR